MKTKFFLAGILLAGSIFTTNAQNVASTGTLTSGGSGAGASGSGTYYGYKAGQYATGSANTLIGSNAGGNTDLGNENTFVGTSSGNNNTTGSSNTFLGMSSGTTNTGDNNTLIGCRSGYNMVSGSDNTYVGFSSGRYLRGTQNICIGSNSGTATSSGSGARNIFIGYNSGYNNVTGSGNVFIGHNAGSGSTGSNKLIIENTNNITTPLIWGDFSTDQVKLNGKVGVGGITTFPTTAGSANVSAYQLFVKGGILTEEVRVMLQSTWADYVFEEGYALPTLKEVESFINENGHLPNVPSAAQVAQDGIELGQIATIQQEKIEELTLYIIQQQKEIEEMKAQHQKDVEELKAMVKQLLEKE